MERNHQDSLETIIKNCDNILKISRSASSANIYLQKGLALIELERIDQAIACFEELATQDPTSETGILYKGIATLYKGIARAGEPKLLDEAFWLFQRAEEKNHKCHEILYWKGKTRLIQKERLDEALQCFNEGKSLDKTNPFFSQGLGEYHLMLKEFATAIKYFEEAQDKHSYCPVTQRLFFLNSFVEASVTLSLSIETKEDKALYEKLVIKITATYPKEPKLFIEQGNGFFKQWKLKQKQSKDELAYANANSSLKQAQENYQKALKLQKNNPIANHNLGLTYQEADNFDEAEKYFSIAIRESPKNVLFLFNRGKLYYIYAKKNKDFSLENKALVDFKLADMHRRKCEFGLSDGNLKLLEKLPSIITALNLTGQAQGTTQILEDGLITESNQKFEKFNEHRLNIVCNLLIAENDDDFLNKHYGELTSMIDELQSQIKAINIRLSTKKDDEIQVFKQALQRIQGLTQHEKELLIKYREAIDKTWNITYLSCQIVCSGQFCLDTSSRAINGLSFLASLIPLFGDKISSSIDFVHEFLQENEVKTRANMMVCIFPSLTLVTQIIGEITCQILSNEKKRNEIISGSHISEESSLNLFQKLKMFYENMENKVDKVLYGDLYPTVQEQMGNEDATRLIEFTIKNNRRITVTDYVNVLGVTTPTQNNNFSDGFAASSSTKFCLCVLSRLEKKSAFWSKRCSLCSKSSKQYYKCRNCSVKKLRMCLDCAQKRLTQQPSQDNL